MCVFLMSAVSDECCTSVQHDEDEVCSAGAPRSAHAINIHISIIPWPASEVSRRQRDQRALHTHFH